MLELILILLSLTISPLVVFTPVNKNVFRFTSRHELLLSLFFSLVPLINIALFIEVTLDKYDKQGISLFNALGYEFDWSEHE